MRNNLVSGSGNPLLKYNRQLLSLNKELTD